MNDAARPRLGGKASQKLQTAEYTEYAEKGLRSKIPVVAKVVRPWVRGPGARAHL